MPLGPDIEAIRAEIRRGLCNVSQERLRELTALLPAGSKSRDDFPSSFLMAATRYWGRLRKPTPKEKDERTTNAYEIKSQLKQLRSLMERLSNATNFSRFTANEISKEIPSMKRMEEALDHELSGYRSTYRTGPTNRRLFVFDVLKLYEDYGGKVGRSRGKRTPSGPTIRYLTLACDLVMGEDAPGSEMLVVYIKKYREKNL